MTLFDMVRVSEINLNEKINLPISPLKCMYYTIFFVDDFHDEKVFFKSSSCLKYIQKNLIEITKKMYTVSHWHADFDFHFVFAWFWFSFSYSSCPSLGTFRQQRLFFSSEEGFQSARARTFLCRFSPFSFSTCRVNR